MKSLSIFVAVAGLSIFSIAVFLTEDQPKLCDPCHVQNTEYNLKEVQNIQNVPQNTYLKGSVILAKESDFGLAREREPTKAKPMAHIQSSSPLRWMNVGDVEMALEIGDLDEHESKAPKMRKTNDKESE